MIELSSPTVLGVHDGLQSFAIDADLALQLRKRVEFVHRKCPGEAEFRYLSVIRQEQELTQLPEIKTAFESYLQPLLVSGLPSFPDVQDSKILALLLGDSLASCVAYSDYNQAYITDIGFNPYSREASAASEVLEMHNDLTFASDRCRPKLLVLLTHIARGSLPPTYFAPAQNVLELLDPESIRILRSPSFEIRCGGKLSWAYEQVRRISVITDINGAVALRMSFANISPLTTLPSEDSNLATRSTEELRKAALEVGERHQHVMHEGEAVLIPNDHCLHGRSPFDPAACDRMVLRAYAVPEAVVAQHGTTMLQLSS